MIMKTGRNVMFPLVLPSGNRISCSDVKFNDDYEVYKFSFISRNVTSLSEKEDEQVKEYLSKTIQELVESEELETFLD